MNKNSKDLTQELLKSALRYDRNTGLFYWIKKTAICVIVGSVAGCKRKDGYITISVLGFSSLSAHRLAWLYVKGVWPEHEIDHFDGDRANNAWKNLRLATDAQNSENKRKAMRNNVAGFLGVTKRARKGRLSYTARIGSGNESIWLGRFKTPEEAHLVYLLAKRNLHEYCTI